MWSKVRPSPISLMVVKGVDRQPSGRRRKQRDTSFFLVAATWDGQRWVLSFPPSELLGHMWQRWEVEVVHRECKSGFGLGEIQCWSLEAAILAVQWQAWAHGGWYWQDTVRGGRAEGR